MLCLRCLIIVLFLIPSVVLAEQRTAQFSVGITITGKKSLKPNAGSVTVTTAAPSKRSMPVGSTVVCLSFGGSSKCSGAAAR